MQCTSPDETLELPVKISFPPCNKLRGTLRRCSLILPFLPISSHKSSPRMLLPVTPSLLMATRFSSQPGSTSCKSTPPKMASSIPHPSALIKPCRFQGETTLEDLNRGSTAHFCCSRSKQWGKTLHSATRVLPCLGSPWSSWPGSAQRGGGRGSITVIRTEGHRQLESTTKRTGLVRTTLIGLHLDLAATAS